MRKKTEYTTLIILGVLAFITIVVVLYAKTDFFKKIWEGIIWFYNWLRSWGQ